MTFVYLHGFNSRGYYDNPKVKALETLGRVLLVNYDSFDTAKNIIASINRQLKHLEPNYIIVGSSLGGFFANRIAAKKNVPSILLNPAFDLESNFRSFIGKTFHNYEDGSVNVFSEVACESYKKFKEPIYGKHKPLVLLTKDDDVIPAEISSKVYEDAIVKIIKKGGHRFDNLGDHLFEIEEYIKPHKV